MGVPSVVPGRSLAAQSISTIFDVTSADGYGVLGKIFGMSGVAAFPKNTRGLKCPSIPEKMSAVKLLEPPEVECPEENKRLEENKEHNQTGDNWVEVEKPKKPEEIKKKPKTGLAAAGLGLGAGVAAGAALSGADGDGAKPEPERSSETHGGEAGETHGGEASETHGGEAGGESADQKAARLRRKLREEEYRQRVYEQKERRVEYRLDQLHERVRQLIAQEQELFKKALDLIGKEGYREEYERLRLKSRQVRQRQNQLHDEISRHIQARGQLGQVLLDISSNIRSLMRVRPDLKSSANRRSLIPTATGSAFWLSTFGNRARYRAQAGGRPELGHLGLAAGYDLRLNATQFGVLAGYGRGELRFAGAQRFMPGPSLFKGPFAGLYVRRDFAPFSVQVGLVGGSLEHTFSRPSGRARAEARTRSWWLAPEARVGLRLDAGPMQFEPSFTASYARQSIRGFTETGIRAPVTVGKRKVELLETRLELKASREVGSGGRIALKAGWQYRDDLNLNQAWVRLLSQSLRAMLESGLGSSFYLGAEAEFELAPDLFPGLFLNLSGEAVWGDGYQNMSGMVSVYQAF